MVAAAAARAQPAADDSLDEAGRLQARAWALTMVGDHDEAVMPAERALAIYEKALGPDHPDVATSLSRLASIFHVRAEHARAESLYARALAIREKAGPDSVEVATTLNNVGLLYQDMDEYARAERSFARALAIYEKALGPDDVAVATSLNNLALLHSEKGDYTRPESLYIRALAIYEKALGPDHSSVAGSLNNLALLYYARGDYAQAEPLYTRALDIYEQAVFPNHTAIATVLNNLAMLHRERGDYARAEPLYARALAINEKALGADHPAVSTPLNNLALLHEARGDHARAEPLYTRALAINERALGPDHTDVAVALTNLASLYANTGDYARAEQLQMRALAIHEKARGPDHPAVAESLSALALVWQAQGNYERAELLHTRALAIKEKASGSDHHTVATSLNSLALLHQARGDVARSVAMATRGAEVRERVLNAVVGSAAEVQKRAYMLTVEPETSQAITLHLRTAPTLRPAVRLALTTILRRKGRVLDVGADTLRVLRESAEPQVRGQLDELAGARAELAIRVLRGPIAGQSGADHHARVDELRATAHQLEEQLGRRYAALRGVSEPITIEQVQAELPPGTALVELTTYQPYDARARTWDEAQYVAYVLHSTGEPRAVELGAAATIDALAQRLRTALADPDVGGHAELARALDERVMRPIRSLLDDSHDVFLSPDAGLSLVPFAALIDEHDQFLVTRFRFTYLTSGRDLVRVKGHSESRSGAVVMAAPAYDEEGSTAVPKQPGRRSVDMGTLQFGALPGTAAEADSLGRLLANVTVLRGVDATEAALKSVAGPRVLHLATHGFFLADLAAPLRPGESAHRVALPENPLLRSGLAFAGANARHSFAEDGILTAMEAINLDLHGTKLVVMSACDTGVGDVVNGDGVYGLRRAFVLAGAETIVMSIWKVDDDATKDLMVGYYQRLRAGGGRSDALRESQLALLRNPATAHPYFWAAFLVSGSGDTLDGKPAPLPTPGRGPRGCACQASDPTEPGSLVTALLVVVGAIAIRRSRRRCR